MGDDSAKQKANATLMARLFDRELFEQVESLPAPVYNFDPTGWTLLVLKTGGNRVGGSEYVAVNQETGEVRFLGTLGD